MPKTLPDKVAYHHFRDMFKYASHGIVIAIKEEVNMKIHLIMTVIVVGLGLFFHLANWEWCIILLCIGGVFALEIVNTAIENIVDFICPEYHIMAGKIKDLASGCVLIFCIFVFIIGLIIFLPHIISLF